MERIGSLVIPDYGLNTNDVKYLSMESHLQGRGPDRLKYLDLEGRWILSGKSIPYISATFNHLERLNDARLPLRTIRDEPLNAIGMLGDRPKDARADIGDQENRGRRSTTLPRTIPSTRHVVVKDDRPEIVPPSPREAVPFRSAGYGLAHQKRKLSIPESRSRSVSPMKNPELDSSLNERRYNSGYNTRYSPIPRDNEFTEDYRPPHRTQGLSSRPSSRTRLYDSDYDPSYIIRDNSTTRYYDELRVGTTTPKKDYLRADNFSPRSIGSAGEQSESSDLASPNSTDYRLQNPDEVVVMAYQLSKKSRSTSPGAYRHDWIRH